MTNFSINFSEPWFLLLLIPAVLLTLIPYFRMAKKYRKTRNRIVSMTLHLLIMALCISTVSGLTFEFDEKNTENEVILLVDASDSGSAQSEQKKDAFMQSVIRDASKSFRVGVVTFGLDQVLAAELTSDTDSVWSKYQSAAKPDTSATDIASALTYAASLFQTPQTARIVLLSDGVETDNRAKEVIKSVAAKGIKVDTVCFPETDGDEVQIVSVETPDRNIRVGEKFNLTVQLESNFVGTASVRLTDNGTEQSVSTVELIGGAQTIEVETTLALPGLHAFSVELSADGDSLAQNNRYRSYLYLESFDDILILESVADESAEVRRMLGESYNITVINVENADAMPKTLDALRAYDEVIMVNVANKDLPDGFDVLLHSYVNEIGGGLFTVCGTGEGSTVEDPLANAFTRDDMYGTLYQKLLPVEIINYTPPVAVVIIIDVSGSMTPEGVPEEQTPLYAAKQGAVACLDALTERDWVGIVTLASEYNEEVDLTPRTQRDKLLSAIEAVQTPENGAGTVYSGALIAARQALAACNVEKRHIILVSDGEPGDQAEEYLPAARELQKQGITFSFMGIGCTNVESMKLLVETTGMTEDHYHNFGLNEIDRVPTEMRQDVEASEIKDVNYETFTPTIESYGSIVHNIDPKSMPQLDGFYGSRAKSGAEVVLMGGYVPIYAQWKYGKGMVGSFMCDLNGTWSSDFIVSPTGEMLLENIVTALFPTENIRPTDITVTLKEENYYNRLSIFTELGENETVKVTVSGTAEDGTPIVQTLYPTAEEGFSRLTFAVKTPGIHEILVEKLDANGNAIASYQTYKAFSYSKEYLAFTDADASVSLMAGLAESGGGATLTDPAQVLGNVTKYLHRVIDPRIVFLIVSLCAFLADIAVRKFKFKWIHEILRERKIKKSMGQQGEGKR